MPDPSPEIQIESRNPVRGEMRLVPIRAAQKVPDLGLQFRRQYLVRIEQQNPV